MKGLNVVQTLTPFKQDMEDSICMFYLKDDNVFIDEDGFVIWSLFELITPNDLFLFKLRKEYMSVQHRSNPEVTVEIYYPDDEEE